MKENKEEVLEEKLAGIEDIIHTMEKPEISLELAFELYQKGVLQLRDCNHMLDKVEKKMQILNENGEMSDL